MKVCQKCGQEVQDLENICPRCGYNMFDQIGGQRPMQNGPRPQPQMNPNQRPMGPQNGPMNGPMNGPRPQMNPNQRPMGPQNGFQGQRPMGPQNGPMNGPRPQMNPNQRPMGPQNSQMNNMGPRPQNQMKPNQRPMGPQNGQMNNMGPQNGQMNNMGLQNDPQEFNNLDNANPGKKGRFGKKPPQNRPDNIITPEDDFNVSASNQSFNNSNNEGVVGVKEWLINMLLMMIPIYGLYRLVITLIGSYKINKNITNCFRASILLSIIMTVVIILLTIILGAVGISALSSAFG